MRIILVFTLAVTALFCSAQAIPSAIKPTASIKSTALLQQLDKQLLKPDSMDVVLSVKDVQAASQWSNKMRVIAGYKPAGTWVCRIKATEVKRLLTDDAILFADILRKPKEELTTGSLDISLNKLSLAHHFFPSVNGENIYVSLKEQRMDTSDIDYKGRYFSSGLAATSQSGHASIMATTLAGAGSSSPRATGAAPGAYITSSDFASLLPDADSIYDKYHITIQNHSYGTGLENYYGADARAYDASVYNHASLLHIFSAGNAGTSAPTDGAYQALSAVSNLTGSFKMAKNIITVGAVDSFNQVMAPSSRGPSYDGRVKPEIVAFGVDGTSGASALVSGAAALVQQAYQLKFGRLPSAALTKAVLLNSADDVDTRQVDYRSGYGSLNAYSALRTVAANHFMEGEVEKGQAKTFLLAVPENIATLKIMLVWIDPPAEANAPKALVNDLDATLSLPATSEHWLPWVLDPSASTNALQLPATRKNDTLNTAEQITLDHPQPGNYTFSIDGRKLITPTQKFAIVYQYDTVRTVTWSYPTGHDVLKAGTTAVLRWEGTVNEEGVIEYSINNGPWQAAVAGIPPGNRSAAWLVPDTTGLVKLKLTMPSSGLSIPSDELVLSRPLQVAVGFNCTDSFMLHWDNSLNDGYQLYRLGEKYLEPLFITRDSFSVLQKISNAAVYYAVAPKYGNHEGLRSYSINYTTQGIQCYFQQFYASLQNNNAAFLETSLGSTYQVKQLSFQKLDKNGFASIHTVAAPSGTTAVFTDVALTKGVNTYRTAITLNNGNTTYSPVESVFYFPDDPVVVYPNPVSQRQPVTFMVKEPGVYTAAVFDANGTCRHKGLLQDVKQQMLTFPLAKGIYFIIITPKEGHPFTQKLLVY